MAAINRKVHKKKLKDVRSQFSVDEKLRNKKLQKKKNSYKALLTNSFTCLSARAEQGSLDKKFLAFAKLSGKVAFNLKYKTPKILEGLRLLNLR